MAQIVQNYNKMYTLDELGEQKSFIHGINPVVKVIVTIAFIITVISYGKYEISGIIPLALYPVVLMSAGNIPFRTLLGGLAIAAPLVVGAGIFNPFLDTAAVMSIYGIAITSGILSLTALLFKCLLTVLAAQLLVATAGMGRIAAAMQWLRIPDVFITQLLLTYRYIAVLTGEAGRIYEAYRLRAPEQKGIARREWGSLLGQLLLRTYDRAARLYQAMKLRGYGDRYFGASLERLKIKDIGYLLCCLAFFALARSFDITMLMGSIVMGMIK